MSRNTRIEILDAAKRLFNERGYNAVSTRDIAEALGISKGNLTYYFKKKEQIVEAILEERPSRPRPVQAPETLEGLDAFLLNMQAVVQENAFYFWHHAQLAQLSPQIRQRQGKVYEENTRMLREAFGALHRDGMLREESLHGEYDRIIDALLLSSIYWMPFCDIKGEGQGNEQFRLHAWSLLYAQLTEKGQQALERLVSFPPAI